MYCFVDESGNTGSNLFDKSQPILYYGVITCKTNLDVLAEPLLKNLRHKLGVDGLHANELGVSRLSEIAPEITKFSASKDVRFSLLKVSKLDYAVITFFDQVFDAGINKAVSWQHYWTPLRYVLLFKVAYLFDEATAKAAWGARLERNPAICAKTLTKLCEILLERVSKLPDERSRDLVSGGLRWAAANPFEIDYGVSNKDSALQISPNLIGFQSVLQIIAHQAHRQSSKVRSIIVDRQTQFNRAQSELADVYRRMRGHVTDLGPGMPKMDMSKMPEVPPTFRASKESAGLELVDLTLWISKRLDEEKALSKELVQLFNVHAKRGMTDDVSLKGLERRWKFLAELPEPKGPLPDEMHDLLKRREQERLKALSGL